MEKYTQAGVLKFKNKEHPMDAWMAFSEYFEIHWKELVFASLSTYKNDDSSESRHLVSTIFEK